MVAMMVELKVLQLAGRLVVRLVVRRVVQRGVKKVEWMAVTMAAQLVDTKVASMAERLAGK
jgi:hypothetical protein